MRLGYAVILHQSTIGSLASRWSKDTNVNYRVPLGLVQHSCHLCFIALGKTIRLLLGQSHMRLHLMQTQ